MTGPSVNSMAAPYAFLQYQAGEGHCTLRRLLVVVITEKAHAKQRHIEALHRTRQHANESTR